MDEVDPEYVQQSGLRVSAPLASFVADEVLPQLGIDIEQFWAGYARILGAHSSRNASLLAVRDDLQAQIDAWHLENKGCATAKEQHEFLVEIGYLESDPESFTIDVDAVDAEISHLAGPQLVVPLSNARYALNAANARWNSLFDALYGTDVIPDDGGAKRELGYNPIRGEGVIAYANGFLDQSLPLLEGSFSELSAIELSAELPRRPRFLLDNGRETELADTKAFIGYEQRGDAVALLFRHHRLHIELVIDPNNPVGKQHRAGIADVLLESAITTIQDCEDSVSAVDVDDKVAIYRNWLGLMTGSLEAAFEKDGNTITRRLVGDRSYLDPQGNTIVLPGRSLMLLRHVGLHMMTDAVLSPDGAETPESFLDALISTAIALYDLRGLGSFRNAREQSVYVVKPKLHGSAEVSFTVELFSSIEELLGLPTNTLKIGIMDEERRTSANLAACIAAARERVIFINTGFLDRTGDEIHTAMQAGPMMRKSEMRTSNWLLTYEDRNVDVGLRAGFSDHAQIGKGMWAAPDSMAEMVATKIGQPRAGSSCAWVPSPTAATLHAMHYHLVDVAERQQELLSRPTRDLDGLFEVPTASRVYTAEEIYDEVATNAQSILGYVVRWVDQGIGCSKVPDYNNVSLMEDRATLRISSQHIANWLHHGVIDRQTVLDVFTKMVDVVNTQNAGDANYRQLVADRETSPAFACACELVFRGTEAGNGYTEDSLHKYRRQVKASRGSSAKP